MQNPRSSSTYSINIPKMIPLSQVTLYYSLSRFKFQSPVRTYLKTNEIKQRQQLHKTLTNKLMTQVSKGHHSHSKTLTKLTRRTSSYVNDKYQKIWESLKFKTIHEPYDVNMLQEFFYDLVKEENFINTDRYEFPIQNKTDFTHFKSYFITVLFHERDLNKYLFKLESIRMSHLRLLSINQELKGFFGLNQILKSLFEHLKMDITLQNYVNDYESVKDIWLEISTNILQPQDDNQKLHKEIRNYAENNKLNHVHFFNFKFLLYKVLLKHKISMRGIKKVLKLLDNWKSTVMRCERIMELILCNYQYLMYCMVTDQKQETIQRRAIELILEYLYNNDHRSIKKCDLKQYHFVHQSMQKVISRLNTSQILIQDFHQDLDSIFVQKLQIKKQSVVEFGIQLQQIPFFMQIYDDYEVNVHHLLETELDFMLSNRTYFRQKEIELIHKNMNISHEVFDLYIMRLQDTLYGVPTKAILNRINQYRMWVVNEKIKTNEIY
ncbi:unnamed protein product [Paramecium pentaurelia]|uniref:Uncharacterized protein n=1 Tax=Paramecium pentaurelia TaxID=43138 RepID=A0A8S1U190_9CILI|nr:unnamed protein product [Paramecium pentaurelia]